MLSRGDTVGFLNSMLLLLVILFCFRQGFRIPNWPQTPVGLWVCNSVSSLGSLCFIVCLHHLTQWIWCWGSIQVCVHAWQALYQVSYTHTYTHTYSTIYNVLWCWRLDSGCAGKCWASALPLSYIPSFGILRLGISI